MASKSDISPVTRAVLFDSDLQLKIFETLDDKTAAHCALVCKAWTENSALDHAWYRVTTSFRQLFNALAPLTPRPPESSPYNGFNFLRPIKSEDRLRLNYYSKRVRCLQLNWALDDRDNHPCDSTFNELLASSDVLSILPNLVKISSPYGEIELTRFIVPFLHSGIEGLGVHLEEYEFKPGLFEFLGEVESRSPHLKELSLNVPENSAIVLERVSQFISKQTSLEEFYQIGTLSLLSALPGLPELKFLALTSSGVDNVQNVSCASCQSGVCFPSLHRLSLEMTFSNATAFISNHTSLSKLTEISVCAYRADDRKSVEDLHELFTVFSKSCPCLEILWTHWDVSDDPIDHINGLPPITCNILAPIASCQRLRALDLSLGRLELDGKELVDLLARFLRLEVLSLRSYSDTYAHAPTPFVLHRIAKVQPDLHRLSLEMVEGSTMTEQLLDKGVPFRRLAELNVGQCRVVDADSTALYLSQILPPECKILTGYYDHSDAGKQWEIVRSRIPFFAALVSQHRHKLPQEVDALQQKLSSCQCSAAE